MVRVPRALRYAISGDVSQQEGLSRSCGASQNRRGGLFFVAENQALHDSARFLISNRRPMSSRRQRGRYSTITRDTLVC